jgi:site-specific recombinase XerD
MKNGALIGPWVRRFLVEYLVIEKNLSKNTQKSYRDTLSLLLPFLAKRNKVAVDKLSVEHISVDSIRDFLSFLQESRNCSAATCNQRLAAIHVLAQFISWRSPEHVAWAGQIRSIPFKKTIQSVVPYLEKVEIDAILASPDRTTQHGQRDHALLLFLYNTGARASEVAQLVIGDLELSSALSVRVLGKGSKVRHCPLWQQTVSAISALISHRADNERIFLNRQGQPLTRFGIHTLVERHSKTAADRVPSIAQKRVSPHTFRHTTAVHLLRAGVDINTIRAWLGHVSLDTTNIYAEVDLEMKSKALALCAIGDGKSGPKAPAWKRDRDLLAFLQAL